MRRSDNLIELFLLLALFVMCLFPIIPWGGQ